MSGTEDLSWLRHRGPVHATTTADDLSWIRHRRVPAGATATATRTAPAVPTTPTPAVVPAVPVAPPDTSLDLSGADTSLDLSSGSGTPPPAGDTSLDLDLPDRGTPPDLSVGGTSLDLSGETTQDPVPFSAPPFTTPPAAAAAVAAPAAGPPAFTPPRTSASAPTVLSPRRPSVQLNRLQSGIGALTFEAAWTPDEGFVLGCAYQMDSGWSSVLRPGETFGPLVMDRRAGHQRLRLDLLHGRHLQRLIVFGVPAADPGPHWAGTLLISTHGHARIEIPIEPPPPGPTVLLSLYNVDGELVLRAEAQTVPGRIRDACLAFGYDRIAWRDADTAIPPAA
ncbi:hypothetical protein AB0K00_15950 [Dactylosporangium sp. NPDC049525]|uniref:hypothetical protein n=1 Tax=Dactylosporangium sp. NPDC049525 TaxID=3154730 RepID=UPI00341D7493